MYPKNDIDPHNRIRTALAMIAGCIVEPQIIDGCLCTLVIRRTGDAT